MSLVIATFCLGAITGMLYTFLACRYIRNKHKRKQDDNDRTLA